MERKNVWKEYTKKELKELERLNKDYRGFLDAGKTERECALESVKMAEKAGYRNLKEIISSGGSSPSTKGSSRAAYFSQIFMCSPPSLWV